MRKQVAVVIDASGSMFHAASPDCAHDKVVEAIESVKWMVDDIQHHLEDSDQWAVSFWYFASSARQLIGQSDFSTLVDDLFLSIIKDTVEAAAIQSETQAAIGSRTDIFGALHQVSDWMESHPPGWLTWPVDGPPDKKTIFFFTDGHQTVSHGGGTTRAHYEAAHGVSFEALLRDRGFILNAQGIGSDLLNATLEDLRDTAATGSAAKVIATTPPYAADCSAAIMTNALKAVNDNGVLALFPRGRATSGLLWEQFRLPVLAPLEVSRAVAAVMVPAANKVNYADFEVEVDGISKQLILGLTWHQPGSPSLQAWSPSGATFSRGVAAARYLEEGWMASLHIPNPEAGTWRVRVFGDRRQAPLRLNLMARGTNPAFTLVARSEPRQLAEPGSVEVHVTPMLDGKPASGSLRVEAERLGGAKVLLAALENGVHAGKIEVPSYGRHLIRVELTGELANGQSVRRVEFTAVQVGRARDPRLTLSPREYQQGGTYSVEVALTDAEFGQATRIRFGRGIEVTGFHVMDAQHARAQIAVAADAMPGTRSVVTYLPDAEGLTEVEVVARRAGGPRAMSRICCLRFDATGALTAVKLCDGTTVRVCKHHERLQKLLERARDDELAVTLQVDAHGCLSDLEICR